MRRGLEGVAGGWDAATADSGEQVQVVGGAGGELLCGQGCPVGEEEPVAGGQGEEQPGHAHLEWGQPGWDIRHSCRRGRCLLDQWCPCGADVAWQDQVVPELDQEHPVEVGEDVVGGAFAEHDLVDACPVGAVV